MPLPNPPYNGLITIGEEDSSQGSTRKINFTGAGVTATIASGQAEISIPGSSGAPSDAEYLVGALSGSLSNERLVTNTSTVVWDLTTPGQVAANVPDASITYTKIQDVSAASKLLGRGDSGAGDVQEITLGTNLSISGTTLNASGGGGGASATTVEVNLGATATWRGRFTITDAGISPTSKLLVWQAPGAYTGKGTRADEAEMQPVSIITTNSASGTATVYWETPPMITRLMNPTSQYLQTGVTNIVSNPKDPQSYSSGYAKRISKVRGNVKFSYVIFS